MRSKTLQVLKKYALTLEATGPNMMADPSMEGGQEGQPQPEAPAPIEPEETMPLTSEGEDKYIKDLIDAALFEPSAEEANTLLNLQSVMELKKYKNAREEVLPFILAIISKETTNRDMRDDLSQLD